MQHITTMGPVFFDGFKHAVSHCLGLERAGVGPVVSKTGNTVNRTGKRRGQWFAGDRQGGTGLLNRIDLPFDNRGNAAGFQMIVNKGDSHQPGFPIELPGPGRVMNSTPDGLRCPAAALPDCYGLSSP